MFSPYLMVTSVSRPSPPCSIVFWNDISVFSGASWKRKKKRNAWADPFQTHYCLEDSVSTFCLSVKSLVFIRGSSSAQSLLFVFFHFSHQIHLVPREQCYPSLQTHAVMPLPAVPNGNISPSTLHRLHGTKQKMMKTARHRMKKLLKNSFRPTIGAPRCPMRAGFGPSVPISLMQGEYIPRGIKKRKRRIARYGPTIITWTTARIWRRKARVNPCGNAQVCLAAWLSVLLFS